MIQVLKKIELVLLNLYSYFLKKNSKLNRNKPKLTDLGLWFRVVVEMPNRTLEEEAKHIADLDALDVITNVITLKAPTPAAQTQKRVANEEYLCPNTVSIDGMFLLMVSMQVYCELILVVTEKKLQFMVLNIIGH